MGHFKILSPCTFINFTEMCYPVRLIGGVRLLGTLEYARAHNAAMKLGFNDDIDTYLLISSKYYFKVQKLYVCL